MADNEVVKTIENVDALFAQIVVNGEVHESSSYVAPEATTPSSSQSQQTTVVEEEEEPEATDGVSEDVYAVELNDTLHNFVDRAVGEALQNEIQTRGEADLQLHNSVVSLGQRVVQAESSVESLSGQVDTFGTELGNVEDLIPSTATPQNELADKDFVNSSIATNTANFLGTYTSLEQITAIANPTNNDYAFLQTVDQAGNTVYQRYKYNANQSSWLFEYSLNNSSFTAEQWATINSGLTQNLVDTAIANAVNGAISDEVIARNQAIAIAITNALDSLDVASAGGSGKYIESISQVDGAIVPVEATIADEVTIGNIHSVSSNAVYNALSQGNTWAINASSTNKLARKGYWYNGSGSTVYKKLGGLVVANEENVFMLQSRAGELIIISVGHGDGSYPATPKIKRLLNVYSKIIGFTLVGTNIIVATSGFSHECVLTQIAGTSSPTLTITDSNSTEYNSGTAITIE